MNDIVKRALGSTALTTDLADRLLAGIEESQATTLVVGGGKDLIKLDKGTGLWNIGQADEPMQVGSKWVINILSICHGYICWSNYPGSRKNERLGEVMVPMSEPKPPKPAPIEGFNFAEQRSFEAVCLNGEDEGKEVMFKNGSVGTMKAFKKLEDAMKAQLRKNPKYAYPVLQFESEKYKHGDYGWIQNPIFVIVGWANSNGDLLADAKGDDTVVPIKPAPKLAAPVAAKPSLKKPAEPQQGPAEAEATEAPRGPRRRPPAA